MTVLVVNSYFFCRIWAQTCWHPASLGSALQKISTIPNASKSPSIRTHTRPKPTRLLGPSGVSWNARLMNYRMTSYFLLPWARCPSLVRVAGTNNRILQKVPWQQINRTATNTEHDSEPMKYYLQV